MYTIQLILQTDSYFPTVSCVHKHINPVRNYEMDCIQYAIFSKIFFIKYCIMNIQYAVYIYMNFTIYTIYAYTKNIYMYIQYAVDIYMKLRLNLKIECSRQSFRN